MSRNYFDPNITVVVEIAFGYGPLEASPVWTDVTDYVRAFSTDRGRSDEFSSFSPGIASVTFSNGDRRFDPSYASGDYFGDLLPMVPIRIWAIDGLLVTDEDGQPLLDDGDYITSSGDAAEYPIFYGFVQGWPQQFIGSNSDSTVTVTAIDGTRLLEQFPLAESVYLAEVEADGPIAYWPMTTARANGERDDAIGNATIRPLGGTLWDVATVDWTPDGAAQAGDDPVNGSSFADLGSSTQVLPAQPLAVECVVEFDAFTPAFAIQDVAFVARVTDDDFIWLNIYGDGIDVTYSDTAANRRTVGGAFGSFFFQTGRAYHVAASMDADDFARIYVDGVLVYEEALTTGDNGPFVNPLGVTVREGNRISQVAVYDTPITAARVLAHYNAGAFAFGGDYIERTGARIDRVLDEAGWPSGQRDVSDGKTECGPYLPDSQSALSYARMIETAEQGYLFIDGGGNVVFRDRQWVLTRASEADYSDNGGDLPFMDVTIDANTVEALRNTAVVTYDSDTVTTTVAASVTAYGVASISVSVPVIQGIDEARGLGSYLTRPAADPKTRIVRLDVNLRCEPATAFPAFLGLELGDVVTVSLTPVNVGSAASYSLSVQGISHEVARGEWLSTLYLAPNPAAAATYFIIGDATYGRLGAAYGNVIPY